MKINDEYLASSSSEEIDFDVNQNKSKVNNKAKRKKRNIRRKSASLKRIEKIRGIVRPSSPPVEVDRGILNDSGINGDFPDILDTDEDKNSEETEETEESEDMKRAQIEHSKIIKERKSSSKMPHRKVKEQATSYIESDESSGDDDEDYCLNKDEDDSDEDDSSESKIESDIENKHGKQGVKNPSINQTNKKKDKVETPNFHQKTPHLVCKKDTNENLENATPSTSVDPVVCKKDTNENLENATPSTSVDPVITIAVASKTEHGAQKYDKSYCCFYCNKHYPKIQDHLVRCHSGEPDVREICSFDEEVPDEKEKKKLCQDKLRQKGDYF